jgi:hypothetical protein
MGFDGAALLPSPSPILENKGVIASFARKFLQTKILTGKLLSVKDLGRISWD